jgi:exosortase/archaeosortase family protein
VVNKAQGRVHSKVQKGIFSIFVRYLLILILGLFNLRLFYFIFKPLTVYGSYYLLRIFTSASVVGNVIVARGGNFEIVNACVVGAAYYLLLILFLSFQRVNLKTRVYALLGSFGLIYLFNVARIVFLISIFGSFYFDSVHWIFWNVLSTVFVVGIFLFVVWISKIREIPFVGDVGYLWGLAKRKKK